MEKKLFRYFYTIESPSDVFEISQEITSLEHPYLLVLIHSYIHNTVIVQSLKKQLQESSKNIQILFAHQKAKRGAKVTVYGMNETPYKESLETEVLTVLQNELDLCENSLKECRSDLVKKYFNDHLTNIPNVFKLRKDLEECNDVTLIDIVIDDFKSINSFYGFFVGDYLLEKLAEYLRKIEGFSVYKMPGGEFILLVNRYYSYYELQEYLKKLYTQLSKLDFYYTDIQISLEFSLAACTLHSIENALSKLSTAMIYAQKNKLPYFVYEERLELIVNYKQNLLLISQVREAIKNDRIVAYYQPIIDNTTQKIVKYETLARLLGEDGEILAPDEFLEISKKTKLYHLVTRKMIQSAFEMFTNKEYSFSINISKEDILNQDTYDFIIEMLKKHECRQRVVFELLEADAVYDSQKILEFINEIKRYDAKIAIDDFGKGHSNFSMIVNMKIDFIKIDGELISSIDTNLASQLIVESIVDFARKLDVKIIAEYVYSSTILSKVKALGIEYSQGFYIDKPRIDVKYTSI